MAGWPINDKLFCKKTGKDRPNRLTNKPNSILIISGLFNVCWIKFNQY